MIARDVEPTTRRWLAYPSHRGRPWPGARGGRLGPVAGVGRAPHGDAASPGASRKVLHRRNLLVVNVDPESADEFVELARDLATPAHSRVVLLYVREVPETLPIDAMERADPDTRFLERFRTLLAGRGIEVSVEVMDTRHAGRAVVDRARAHRARALLMAEPGARGGRLGPVAAYALRHLDGPRLILVSG